jgi:hypothetical protein
MLYHVYEGHTKSNEHVCMMLKQMCNILVPHFMKSTFWSLHFCQCCSACICHCGRCLWPCLPSFMDSCIFHLVLATHCILKVTKFLVFWCGQVWAVGRSGGLCFILTFPLLPMSGVHCESSTVMLRDYMTLLHHFLTHCTPLIPSPYTSMSLWWILMGKHILKQSTIFSV